MGLIVIEDYGSRIDRVSKIGEVRRELRAFFEQHSQRSLRQACSHRGKGRPGCADRDSQFYLRPRSFFGAFTCIKIKGK